MFPLHAHVFDGFKLFRWTFVQLNWRYGEEQIAITDAHLSSNGQHWSFLVLKVTCLTICMFILVTLLTHLELHKAESVCIAIAAIKCIWINNRSHVHNWKSVLLIFIVYYSAQEKEYGNGMKKWEGEKGPTYKLGMGPRGLNPALSVNDTIPTYLLEIWKPQKTTIIVESGRASQHKSDKTVIATPVVCFQAGQILLYISDSLHYITV